MTEAIIVALITGGISLIGTLASTRSSAGDHWSTKSANPASLPPLTATSGPAPGRVRLHP